MTLSIPPGFEVLLLEDDPINQEIFNGYLEFLGISPATTLETLAEAASMRDAMLAGHFDLVVFDVMLPDGESILMAQELAEKLPCPFAAYTARAAPMELRQLRNAGFGHIFSKPLPFDRFKDGMGAIIQ